MAGEVSSAGIKISYCAEATAGTRPTSGYKEKATSAVQGAVQLIENEYAGWAANPTT